ncbi:MAG TPA: 2-hydroxyacid dehydrogenase [Actinomycetota bacterium]|nr:2-hydroxyacid dehydrogenase [Actinomycetota bacterium]
MTSDAHETHRPAPVVAVGFGVSTEVRGLVEDRLSPLAKVVFLKEDEEHLSELLQSIEILITWNPWRELGDDGVAALRSLRFVQLISAGADHVRFGDLPESVVVASNPGAYAEAMAEHIVGMVLALAKRLPHHHAELARGVFDQRTRSRSLKGAVCGILGFGGIGKATAHLLRPFGAEIVAVNSTGQTDEPVRFAGTLTNLDEVLEMSDVVVIALPLTRRTHGLIGRRELGLIKPDAILINVARGAIVDEEALYRHLETHPDFMAGIDAWWDEPHGREPFRTNFPFFDLPNVLGSPHNSALVPGFELPASQLAVDNVERYLRGQGVRGVVRREDYPA